MKIQQHARSATSSDCFINSQCSRLNLKLPQADLDASYYNDVQKSAD